MLIAESRVPVTLSADGCRVISGEWHGPYTARTVTHPGNLDIDHLAPLKEAHRSGAAAWGFMTGAELKAHRVGAKLSRRALAEKAGVHMDTVRYWEGKPEIGPRRWAPQRLAETLGLEEIRAYKRAWVRGGGVLCAVQTMPKPTPQPFPALAKPKRKRRVVCGAKTRKGIPCRAKSKPGAAE